MVCCFFFFKQKTAYEWRISDWSSDVARPIFTACLLHDIGHLVGAGDEGLAAQGVDARHENIAAVWLQQYFPDAVVEPVRLHVEAKRYPIGRASCRAGVCQYV